MKRARGQSRNAFTLIELLVVVAIIGLLISILLPALRGAKEQGRQVKCLANLKSIGHAMSMYFIQESNWFPFEKRDISPNTPVTAFYYGGHPGRRPWWGYSYQQYRDSPKGRPFNPLLYNDLSDRIDQPSEEGTAEYERRRDMPIFECPSDVGGFVNNDTSGPDTNAQFSTYYQHGSSYDMNYHFVWRWASKTVPQGVPAQWKNKYLSRANNFLRKQIQFHSSRFVILFEDPFDSAQWENIPRRGWHQKWNRHSLLFLDSHAENLYTDTAAGNSGTGWKTASGQWWNDPNDPDYQWRMLGP